MMRKTTRKQSSGGGDRNNGGNSKQDQWQTNSWISYSCTELYIWDYIAKNVLLHCQNNLHSPSSTYLRQCYRVYARSLAGAVNTSTAPGIWNIAQVWLKTSVSLQKMHYVAAVRVSSLTNKDFLAAHHRVTKKRVDNWGVTLVPKVKRNHTQFFGCYATSWLVCWLFWSLSDIKRSKVKSQQPTRFNGTLQVWHILRCFHSDFSW